MKTTNHWYIYRTLERLHLLWTSEWWREWSIWNENIQVSFSEMIDPQLQNPQNVIPLFQTFLSLATLLSSSWGIRSHTRWSMPRISPFRSGFIPVSASSLMCPEDLQRKTPKRHSNQILDQLKGKRAGALVPLDVGTLHPISKVQPCHLT